MRLTAVKRIILVAACTVAASSCDDAGGTPVTPPGTPPLGTGLWYLNTVEDSALGSTIATRSVGVALERTVIDSGWINVTAAGGYEQRYWLRVFVTGVLDRTETVIDLGTWSQTGPTYTFTSDVRPRQFTVSTAIADQLTSDEPFVFFANAPRTAGLYRRSRP